MLPSFSLGDYLPIEYLQKKTCRIVKKPEPGNLLNDDFAWSWRSSRAWSELWAREDKTVSKRYSGEGKNNSQCLLIESHSTQDWAYPHNKLIEARTGEVFGFHGKVKTTGKEVTANLSLVLFDANRGIIRWHYGKASVDHEGEWVELSSAFTIPEGVHYIQFRLTGWGKGQTRVDDVVFYKDRKTP